MPPTRSVIITGGSAGLGFETAKVIARDRGAMVVIASRYPRLGQGAVARLTAFGGRAAFLPLDLAAQASIREFVDAYRNAGLPLLKGVICNAGMQNVAAPTKTIEGYETNFAVNHLGHYLLTRPLFDDMAQDGRITFVSSGAHDPKERTGLPAPVRESADAVAHDFEAKVRKYQGPLGKSSPNDVSRAYVAIRHCLYLGDPEVFAGMLTNADRESFKSWRAKHDKDGVKQPAPDGVKQPDSGSLAAALS